MEPENTPLEIRKSSEPNHRFQVQAVDLPGCKTWVFFETQPDVHFVNCSAWDIEGALQTAAS